MVGVHEASVNWVNSSDGVKNAVNEATCAAVPTFAFGLVNQKLQKLDEVLLVLQKL